MKKSMPLYNYRGLTKTGDVVGGERESVSSENLLNELEQEGVLVQSIHKKAAASFFKKRTSPKVLLMFIHEFSVMLHAGMSIHESLRLMEEDRGASDLKLALKSIVKDVSRGELLSTACSQFPSIFEPLFIRVLKVGEESGDMGHALESYHQFLVHKIALRKKVSQAMVYPIFLLVAMSVIIGALLLFVMPRFLDLYTQLDADLPVLTGLLIQFIDYIYVFFPIGIIIAVSAVGGYNVFCKTDAGKFWNDGLKLKMPFVGLIYSHAIAAQSARMLGVLVASGTPLVDALKSTAQGTLNSIYAHRLEASASYVSEGNSLAYSLQKADVFPVLGQRIIRAGEKAGSLSVMLVVVAEFYEESVGDKLERLISLIEPILILFMGMFIGGIIVIMYLPIIHMAEIIQ